MFELCRELRDILLLGGGAGTGEGEGYKCNNNSSSITGCACIPATHHRVQCTGGTPNTLYSIIRMYIPCQVEQLQENLEPENTVREPRGQVPGTWQAGVAPGGRVKGRDLVVMACTLDMPLLTE